MACVTRSPRSRPLRPGHHGTTFGGNPVACAAGLAVLDTLAAEGALDQVKRLGERLRDGIEGLKHPLVSHVRGAGLLLGIVLTVPVAAQVQQAAQDAGLLVNAPAPDVVRHMPALIITDAEVDAFLEALPAVLDGAVQYNKSDDTGALAEQNQIPIFNGSVPPGDHTLQVLLQLQGNGYGVFSYLKSYHIDVRSTHSFTAVEGKTRVWALVEPIGRIRLAAPETRPASSLFGLGFGPAGTLAAIFRSDKGNSARLQCAEGGVTIRSPLPALALNFAAILLIAAITSSFRTT